MKIIFAQGNPGIKYTTTRHNVGWQVIDALAKEHQLSFTNKPKFLAEIAETTIQDEKIVLVKPTTFYNEPGQSARAIVDFYKLDPAQDVLVVHDDLALPFGTLRTREKGSDAGNNGIKSLNAHLGPDYARLRIGIDNDLRIRIPDADFVLSQFSADEIHTIQNDITPKALEYINNFINNTHQNSSHTLEKDK